MKSFFIISAKSCEYLIHGLHFQVLMKVAVSDVPRSIWNEFRYFDFVSLYDCSISLFGVQIGTCLFNQILSHTKRADFQPISQYIFPYFWFNYSLFTYGSSAALHLVSSLVCKDYSLAFNILLVFVLFIQIWFHLIKLSMLLSTFVFG